MPRMNLPVLDVPLGQGLIPNHQQVFGVLFLSRSGEIEGPGNNGFPIDNHDLVVGDSVGSVNQGWDSRMSQEIRRGILVPPLALIQDDLDLDPSLMGGQEGFSDRGRCEGVSLNQD